MLELPLLALLIFLPGLLALRQGRQGRQLEEEMTSDMINIKMLSISVPGQPGQDYPILATVPSTSFRSQSDITYSSRKVVVHFPILYYSVAPIRSRAGAMPTLTPSVRFTTPAPRGKTSTTSSSAGCVPTVSQRLPSCGGFMSRKI